MRHLLDVLCDEVPNLNRDGCSEEEYRQLLNDLARLDKFYALSRIIDSERCPKCGGCHLTAEQFDLLCLPEVLRRRCNGTYTWSANKIFSTFMLMFRQHRDMSQEQKVYFTNTVLKADSVDMATTSDHR